MSHNSAAGVPRRFTRIQFTFVADTLESSLSKEVLLGFLLLDSKSGIKPAYCHAESFKHYFRGDIILNNGESITLSYSTINLTVTIH